MATATARLTGLTNVEPCPNDVAARSVASLGGDTDPRNAGVPSDQHAPIPSDWAVFDRVRPGTLGAKLMNAVLHDLAKSVWNGTLPSCSPS